MNTDFWVKITTWRLLGKDFLSKEEVCTEKQYEGEAIEVQVPVDYYKSEFDIHEKKKKQKGL